MTQTEDSDLVATEPDVEIPDDKPYQVLPPLDEDEYSSLESDIINNGVREPVTVDEEGVPIDGYTRSKIAKENDIEIPVKVEEGLSEREKRDLAYRLNLNRRHMNPGEKEQIVRQYLLEDWDGDNTGEWYDEVASTLGVGGSTVRKAFTELRKDGKLAKFSIFSKEEERRQVREYIQENPDSSNREVADGVEADLSHATVGNWRGTWESKEDSDGSNDDAVEKVKSQKKQIPKSFSDFSNISKDETEEEVEDIDDPTEVTENPIADQLQEVETVEVVVEEGEIDFTIELSEKTYERAKSYGSNFGYETVEELLLNETIPNYLESDEGKQTIADLIDEKAKARGY